jgi:predicted phosphatase
MIFAVDFDNVIHDAKNPLEGKRMGAPIEGARSALQILRQKGKVIIFSVWGNNPKPIEEWLRYYDIPFDSITNIKPQADCYIDDKAIRFTNWDNTLEQCTKDI